MAENVVPRWVALAAILAGVPTCRAVIGLDELRVSDGAGGASGPGGAGGCGGDTCVDASCADGQLTSDESDVDCGGLNCAPCEDGKTCSAASDCESGACSDGVCCESACDDVCVACIEAKTGVADGACAAVMSGTDPDDECGEPADCTAETCSGAAGACEPASSEVICRPAQGECDVAEQCSGAAVSCPDDAVEPLYLECTGRATTCDGGGSCSSWLQWGWRYGGPSNGDISRGVASDAQGNMLLVGAFKGEANFGGDPLGAEGEGDIVLAKYDGAGQHVWSKGFGGSADDVGLGVAVDAAGNAVITGSCGPGVDFGGETPTNLGDIDGFVAKYDSNGDVLWAKRFGGGFASSRGIAVHAATGDIAVTGSFSGTVSFDGTMLTSTLGDAFLARYSGTGTLLWVKQLGFTASGSGLSVAFGAAGNLYVAALFGGTVSLGADTWTSCGNMTSSSGLFGKFDSAGNYLWSKAIGSATCEVFNVSLGVDGGGTVVVVGSFSGQVDWGAGSKDAAGTSDGFVVGYDASGAHQWSRQWSGGMCTPQAVSLGGQGEVFVSGRLGGTVEFAGKQLSSTAGDQDVFLVKLGTDGETLAGDVFPGGDHAIVAAVPGGGVFMTGSTPAGATPIDLGAGALDGSSGDAFLTKYDF